jgi:small subunit ribosomal protein S9
MAETKVENPDTNKPAIQISEGQPKTAPNPAGQAKGGFWWGTGRRKTSVARVRIKPGSGKLTVNKKQLDEYFKREQDRSAILAPLRTVKAENNFDVFINVKGGGTTGQAGASLLGIARALRNYDINMAGALRDGGHLTRDPRMVERKKPGQSGARRRYQFSKR